jgi:hypothetical protein
MKAFAITLFISFLPFSLTISQTLGQKTSSDWHVFKSETNGFSIEFPNKPEYQTFKHEERGFAVSGDQFSVRTKTDFYTIVVSRVPYEASLEDRVNSAVSRMKSVAPSVQEVSRRQISLSKCKGVEVVARSSYFPVIRMRIVLTSDRLYVLSLISSLNEGKAKLSLNRFFNSFKISECD